MFDPRPLVGRTLDGQFRLDALLGQGGFGAVFRACDLRLDRPVAVKVLMRSPGHGRRPEAARGLTERFRREAQLQARLRHPSTVRLLHFGGAGALSYMVQEYVEGHTLRRVVDEQGPLAPERVVSLFGQLLDALDEAHAHGIVHRDLKPDNIMLVAGRRSEEARLLDFGIAKILEDTDAFEDLTASGMLIGTPAWMAPEQINRQPVTARADLYALGCVMYYALTGRKPFDGPPRQVVIAHLVHPPTPLPPSVPPALAATVLRAMEKAPEARFPTALAMLEALTGEAAAAPPDGWSTERTPAQMAPTLVTAPPDKTPLEISNILGPEASPPRRRRRRWLALPPLALGVAAATWWLAPPAEPPADPPAEVVRLHAAPAPKSDPPATAPPEPPDAAPPTAPVAPAPEPRPAEPVVRPTPARPTAPEPPTAAKAPARPPRAKPVDALLERFDAALDRCACAEARGLTRDLLARGVDREALWSSACGRADGGEPSSRCAAMLDTKLSRAMETCPCHGRTVERLVEQLDRDFGVSRRTAWSRRCATPGLPGSCL